MAILQVVDKLADLRLRLVEEQGHGPFNGEYAPEEPRHGVVFRLVLVACHGQV